MICREAATEANVAVKTFDCRECATERNYKYTRWASDADDAIVAEIDKPWSPRRLSRPE
jgi:hypothetical protein